MHLTPAARSGQKLVDDDPEIPVKCCQNRKKEKKGKKNTLTYLFSCVPSALLFFLPSCWPAVGKDSLSVFPEMWPSVRKHCVTRLVLVFFFLTHEGGELKVLGSV